jgi:probable rRNA maturation factor
MIEVEVFGAGARADSAEGFLDDGVHALAAAAPRAPTFAEVQRLCILAAASAGVQEGHLAIEFVDAERITRLNAEYRKQPTPTDVLSFPVDGADQIAGVESVGVSEPIAGEHPQARSTAGGIRELGDVVICPEHTVDLREAIVHGVLHLLGMDHETDNGEMLALQRELLAWESR